MTDVLSSMEDYNYKNARAFMEEHWACKFDSFSMGAAVAQLILLYPRTTVDPLLKRWIQQTMHPNAFERWDAATAAAEWHKLEGLFDDDL